MDPLNVKEFTIALQGEAAIRAHVEKEIVELRDLRAVQRALVPVLVEAQGHAGPPRVLLTWRAQTIV
jgi:hypothetical protein